MDRCPRRLFGARGPDPAKLQGVHALRRRLAQVSCLAAALTVLCAPQATAASVVGNPPVLYRLTLLTYAELVQAGVTPAEVDGLPVSTQGEVDAPWLPAPLPTDDPATVTWPDPTEVVLSWSTDLSTSTKTGENLGDAPLEPGDLIAYEIAVRNTGDVPATTHIVDDLPAAIEDCNVLEAPAGTVCTDFGGVNDTGQLKANGFIVPPGGVVWIRYNVRVRDDAVDATKVRNSAVITNDESDEVVHLSAPMMEVYARPDFSQSLKGVSGHVNREVEPGDEVTYTILVTNTGNRPATGIVVKDDIDKSLTSISAGQGGVVSPYHIRWTEQSTPALSLLEPGKSVGLTFSASVRTPLDDGIVILNQAVITANESQKAAFTSDPDTPEVGDPTRVTVRSAPDLTTTVKGFENLSGSDGDVRPGHRLRYTIEIQNTGTAIARDVTVSDEIDENLINVVPLDGGVWNSGTILWSVGKVYPEPNPARQLRFEATVRSSLPDKTLLPNQAFVSAEGLTEPVPSGDPRTTRLGDPTIVVVNSDAVIKATKSVSDPGGEPTMPGDRLDYRIILESTGDGPVREISVDDPIDCCLTDLQVFDGGSYLDGAIVWSPQTTPELARMDAGEMVELRFRATVAPGTPHGTECANQAWVTSSDLAETVPSGDPRTPAPDDPTIVVVQSWPEIEGTKAVSLLEDRSSNGQFSPGDRIRYTIRVANEGTEPAQGVIVEDPLPAELINVEASQEGVISGGVVTWSIGDLLEGEAVTLLLDGDLIIPLDDGTVVENQAQISWEDMDDPVLTGDPATPEPADPTRIVLFAKPVFELTTKAVELPDGEPARPGDLVDYSITVRNTGTSLARDVSVTDVIDENLDVIAVGQGGHFDESTRTVSWSLGTMGLSPEGDVEISFQARLHYPLDNGTVVDNQAFVHALELTEPVPSGDPRTTVLGDPTRLIVVAGADLTSSIKTVDAEQRRARPGEDLEWTITIRNEGDSIARDVVVTDSIDPALVDVHVWQGGAISEGVIVWDATTTPALASIAPGEELDLGFVSTVAIPLDDGYVIENQAWLRASDMASDVPTSDPLTQEPYDSTKVTVQSSPDLSASVKAAGADPVSPGENLIWTITISNTGDMTAREVAVVDELDPNLEFVSADAGGVYDEQSHSVSWLIEEVVPSSEGGVTLDLVTAVVSPLDDGTVLSNQAVANAPDLPSPSYTGDPRTPASGDITEVMVESEPLLALTKSAGNLDGGPGPGQAEPGDRIRYALVLENTGDMVARGVELSDIIDSALTDVHVDGAGSYDPADRTVSWPPVDAAPGEPLEFNLTAVVAPLLAGGTMIENQAVAKWDGEPLVSSDISSPGSGEPTRVEVIAAPVLSMSTKEVHHQGDGPVRPGDRLAWTIVVRNTGNTYATGVVVEDFLDPWLTDVEPGQGGVLDGDTIRWDESTTPGLEALGPEQGDDLALTFTSRVREDAPDGTTIWNQAWITAEELDEAVGTGDPSTPASGDPTAIEVSFPRIAASKSVENVSGEEVEPGDTLRWTIELLNEGTHAATNLVVSDPLDTEHLVDIEVEDGGVISDGRIVWEIELLSPGSTVTLSFTSRVRPLLAGGTVISNQAFINAHELIEEVPTFDPSTPEPDDPTEVIVVASPDFSRATKAVENLTGDDDQVRPGDRLRYTLTFKNEGNTTANGVEIIDPIDGNLVNVTLEPEGVFDGEIARWTSSEVPALESIPPGLAVIFVIEATVEHPLQHGTTILNQGRIVADENPEGWLTGDPRTAAVGDPTVVQVWSLPRFSGSEKSVENLDGSLDEVKPGDLLEYTLVIVNDGAGESSGTVLIDPVPSWTTYESGSTTLNGEPVPDVPGGGSPLAEGIVVQSARPGTPPGTVLVERGQPPNDEVAIVEFRVRVAPDAPGGTVISNQGFVSCDDTDAVGTGDPRTDEVGDPTLVFVDKMVHLAGSTKTWSLVENLGTPGVVQPGDTVAYEITLINRGNYPARDVLLTDSLPGGSSYVPGTLTLDGQGLSDVGGEDGGQVIDGVVTVGLAELEAGDRAKVRFEALVLDDASSTLVNQGKINARGPNGTLIDELTDADPSTPGAQPTIIPVGDAPVRDLSASTKSVADLDGDKVEPGDLLRYTVMVRNTGNTPLDDVIVTDDVPGHTRFVRVEEPDDAEVLFEEPPAGADGQGRIMVVLGRALEPGAAVPVSFLVEIEEDVALGTVIENIAWLEASETSPVETNPVRVIVGGAAGTGGFSGRVFRDLDGTGEYDPGDPVFSGFEVKAVQVAEAGGDERGNIPAAVTDEAGRYLLLSVPTTEHRLIFRTPSGVSFYETRVGQVDAGMIHEHNGLIDPSGIIYREGTASGVPQARSWLLYHESMVGHAPLPCDDDQRPIELVSDPEIGASELNPLPRPVGASCLPDNQQGQVAPSGEAAGFYRFDVPPSDPPAEYRLQVVPPTQRLAFPSITSPPREGFASPGRAVESAVPDPEGPQDYWLGFRIGSADDEVTNNHVPLDAMETLVAVQKVAGKATVSVGEMVPYTVTVSNRSGRDIRLGEDGAGLFLRDLVPDGMRYVRGTSRAHRVVTAPDGSERKLCPVIGEELIGCPSRIREPEPMNALVLDYGPFDLPAGQSIELRYTLVAAADAEVGEKVNRVFALLEEGTLGEAQATVRLVADPIFELGTLYGKVYCDENEDGVQDPEDLGLAGVRVYSDMGHYAVSDGAGKWHLQRIPPGMHLLKLDERTLPPGSALLDHAARPFFVTPGLDTVVNWRVSCDLDAVEPQTVTTGMEASNDTDSRPQVMPRGTEPPKGGAEKIRRGEPRPWRAWTSTEQAVESSSIARAGEESVVTPAAEEGTLLMEEDLLVPDDDFLLAGEAENEQDELEGRSAGSRDLQEGTLLMEDDLLVPDDDFLLVGDTEGGQNDLDARSTSLWHIEDSPWTDADDREHAGDVLLVGDIDVSKVPAARTIVYFPPEGATVRSGTLGLTGYTVPGNEVTVNGRDIDVGNDGHFHAVTDLPHGPSTVVVTVRDPAGNEAEVRRDLVSEPDGLFVLAMADTHAGRTGAELAGVSERTSIGWGPVYLHGRGVAYAKGQWRLDGGPIEDLALTLHLDSAKQPDASYFADLIQTDRGYPIFGDSGEEVQDVAALGPLFLSVMADKNELRLGNFQTEPGVGGLFQYRRSFYGARLKLDQPMFDGAAHTRGEVFVAGDPAGIQPGHVVMQGTGGSLYFLRHRDIIEGSERLRIIVRDRNTGMVLASRHLTRNVEYTVRHREGQIMLMSPLPSVVEADWMAGMNLASTLDGHPVFLVAEYEHFAAPGEVGVAAGGYVTETLMDWLTVGGGVLGQSEGFGEASYGLWGFTVEARPLQRTFVRGEIAQSRGADIGAFYSADGGLSFSPLLPHCNGLGGDFAACGEGGSAFKLEAGTTLGDLLESQEELVRASLHLHLQDSGFYGSQLLLDQGQRRLGGEVAWDITERDVLTVRAHRVASELPLGEFEEGVDLEREIVRGYGGLRYQREEERWRAAGEWSFGMVRDTAAEDNRDRLDTHRLAAGGEYDATERLSLLLEQDLVIGGDGRLLAGSGAEEDATETGDDAVSVAAGLADWNDRLTTTFGGRWLLTESLRLSALGQVRWNGEHSALLGVQAKTGERGSVHARQRITRLSGGSGWRSQSIVGGEHEIMPGMRSYGEYQLDGGMSDQRGRAIIGMSNLWHPLENVTLGLSYERVQVMGDPGQGPVVPGATADAETGRVSTSGLVDGLPAFDAVGVNPAGAFYPGAVSRDAASASAEYLGQPIKGSARLELRHDNVDEELAATMPGVANRLQTVALGNAAWTWTRDLSAIGRFRYAGTVNRDRQAEGKEGQEALWMEATGGLAFRPETYDWLNVLAKYTRLVDQRPLDLTLGTGDRHSSHVVSVAPVVRTPWRATLTEKIAYKHTRMDVGIGEPEVLRPPEATAHTLLWINRLDLHILPRFDLTGEYRVLWVGTEDASGESDAKSTTTRSGLVLEVALRAAEQLRLGVGYSFASFSDNELSRLDTDESGPFLRVTGVY